MANDSQTALMQSIQRKKDRVKKLEAALQKSRPGYGEDQHNYWAIIDALKVEITEDEKLLAVDRENVIEFAVVACNTLMSEAINGNEIMDTFDMCLKGYKEKYGTDGK